LVQLGGVPEKEHVPMKTGFPRGVATIELAARLAGKVNAVPGLFVPVSMGMMLLLLVELAGGVEVVTSTVLSGVPVIFAVTTSSLKIGVKLTLHDGGRQAAVISANPGAIVPTVPRLTLASAG
jgi:hypothetical protein